jgi:hypothetical protein
MKKNIKIRDLCSKIHGNYYADLEIENNMGLKPSPERIKQIAKGKLEQSSNENQRAKFMIVSDLENKSIKKRRWMKKNTLRIAFIAALISLVSVGVGAAFGGLEYFKSIFGMNAATIQEDIRSLQIFKENGEYKITAETLLSDGYKTNVIVSLESLKGEIVRKTTTSLFDVKFKNQEQSNKGVSYAIENMDTFGVMNKNYYRIEVSSLEKHLQSTIIITLEEGNKDLKIEVPVKHSVAAREFLIGASKSEDRNYMPEKIQLSPLGVMVIGSEKKAKGGLPTAEIWVVMKDGSTDEILSTASFSGEDDNMVVSSGGGVVLSEEGQEEPLVNKTMGERNKDGKVVTTAYFSRILNLEEVKGIRIDGIDYQ